MNIEANTITTRRPIRRLPAALIALPVLGAAAISGIALTAPSQKAMVALAPHERAVITMSRTANATVAVQVRFPSRGVDRAMFGAMLAALPEVADRYAGRADARPNDSILVEVFDRYGLFFHMAIGARAIMDANVRGDAPADYLLLGAEQGFDAARGEKAMRLWAASQPTSFLDRLGL